MGKPGVSTLSTEQQSRIRAGLRMGLSISELARVLDTTRDKVRWVGDRAGLTGRKRRQHVCACGQLVKQHHPRKVLTDAS